jgi:hypothetical protein
MRKRGITRVLTIALAGLLSVGSSSLVAAGPAAASGAGSAGRFPATPRVDNPLFPLPPGTTFVYDGTTGKHREHETVKVTSKIKRIDGISCVQVVDSNWVVDRLVERTQDWFAQDFDGNVWYMGEYATQYKHGNPVGHEGSWLAGKDGAKAGIIMEAHPRVGDTYKQEDYPGVAEDRGKVLAVDGSVETPYGTWINEVLVTKDYSAIEPGVEHKFYVPGIGLVKSADVKGGSEVMELTGVLHG